MEKPMQIVCRTDADAVHVLQILLAARLLPRRDYEIHPPYASPPPITFTLRTAIPDARFAQICCLADTTILRSVEI